ncbi:MAG: tyrosine--tRNA ligase [Candidatus Diapherotrites archaeon CG10_big_fil_rev_8_21_14_0_10_31_34]|nr:MAG: tyrosine--tRNA ligase [Candidatus Diapherotrites archaeon CG10_big_fil_rev_8_21_14_0_10_31_34]
MDLMQKIQLIEENTVELITQEEILELLKEKKHPITYCGYEPSGEVHLGHMVTAIKLSQMEKTGFKVKILLADWHAFLNKKGTEEEIIENVKLWKKVFSKLGIKEPEFILGSSFQKNQDYIEDLFVLSLNTTINRGLRAMQEVARDIDNATVSQSIYPLMQINDIKHLKIDVAQSGVEQRKIHMLAREILGKINYKKSCFVHTPLIDSMQKPGTKMSSSDSTNLISVRDTETEIKKKINKAYCIEGDSNNALMQIMKLIVFPKIKFLEVKRPEKFGGNIQFNSFAELEKAFNEKKLHPMDLKNSLAKELDGILDPVRKVFKG